MADGIKVHNNCGPIFLLRKHKCPKCKCMLMRMKRARVVNSFSAESKEYDFSLGDTFLVGDIKFINYYFVCEKCNTVYEIQELKNLEKEMRRTKIRML